MKSNYDSDPIMNIHWVDAARLEANQYNPNMVFSPELRLLEKSILAQGWIQPVIVNRDMLIVDGFHRWKLSTESKALKAKYKGKLPVVILDIDKAQAMIITIRMNRAKGSHAAFRMSTIIKELIDTHKLNPVELAAEIGATRDEIDLLYQDNVFTQRDIKNYKYSKAWYPAVKGA